MSFLIRSGDTSSWFMDSWTVFLCLHNLERSQDSMYKWTMLQYYAGRRAFKKGEWQVIHKPPFGSLFLTCWSSQQDTSSHMWGYLPHSLLLNGIIMQKGSFLIIFVMLMLIFRKQWIMVITWIIQLEPDKRTWKKFGRFREYRYESMQVKKKWGTGH